VAPDLVFVATKLEGRDTFFLPLKKGRGTGAGDRENPNGHRTVYL
jgi:type I restriction enzyme R subunit